MKTRFLRTIVEKGFLPGDDADTRLKKVALTLVPMIIAPLAMIWGTVYIWLGHAFSGGIPIAYAVLSVVSLAYYLSTKKTGFLQYSQLLLVLILPFMLMWSLGGFAHGSVVMIWGIFSPVAAVLFLSKTKAFAWFANYFILVLVSAMIDPALQEMIEPLPPAAITTFFFLNIGFGSAGLYLMISYSHSEEQRAIEEVKQERERLAIAEETARNINRMLHTVLDTIPVRIFWKDRQHKYLGCNKLFARDMGRNFPESIIGVSDAEILSPEVVAKQRRDDQQVLADGASKLAFEVAKTNQEGVESWVRCSKVPLRNASGEIIGVLGMYEDITQEKQIAAALVKARDEAEAASKAKSEFLASMSHELRTPLNAILGFSQLISSDDAAPAHVQEQAEEIERAGAHLLALVNDLIDLARIEASRMDLVMEPVSVKAILADSLSMVAPLARKMGIDVQEMECHCDVDAIAVRSDYVRLRQVIINLISNAIKYNRPHHGRVRISCSRTDESVRISVNDTGFGIPVAKQERIFNAFDRLGREGGNIEGTGIGLVITRRIVDAMGGKIGFTSVEGQGSTFWVEFPVTQMVLQNDIKAPAMLSGGEAVPDQMERQVLYVEDSEVNRLVMQGIFAKRKDLKLRCAETAEIGLSIALIERPDLILMDINLPGMDGFEALSVLKSDSRTSDIPVIAVTANAMKEDREQIVSAGFQGYVTKPVNIRELYCLLDETLMRHPLAA